MTLGLYLKQVYFLSSVLFADKNLKNFSQPTGEPQWQSPTLKPFQKKRKRMLN